MCCTSVDLPQVIELLQILSKIFLSVRTLDPSRVARYLTFEDAVLLLRRSAFCVEILSIFDRG